VIFQPEHPKLISSETKVHVLRPRGRQQASPSLSHGVGSRTSRLVFVVFYIVRADV